MAVTPGRVSLQNASKSPHGYKLASTCEDSQISVLTENHTSVTPSNTESTHKQLCTFLSCQEWPLLLVNWWNCAHWQKNLTVNITQFGTARWNLKRVCSALNNTTCLALETDKYTALLWVNAPKCHSENPLKIWQLNGFYNICLSTCITAICTLCLYNYLHIVSTCVTICTLCPPVWQLPVSCVHQYDC